MNPRKPAFNPAPNQVPLPDAKFGRGKAGRYWLALALAGVAGFSVILYRGLHLPPALPPMSAWEDAPAKAKAAAYLNAMVKLKDFKADVHEVDMGENFWSIAKEHQIDIDTLIACNIELDAISADYEQPLLVVNKRGSLHQVQPGENLLAIAAAYGVSPTAVAKANRMTWFGPQSGQVLFIPGAKPRELNADMAAQFALRKLFRSPLSGKYTSLMGTRIDPFTGDGKYHNGVDIKAPLNAYVSAAAGGTVILAGWNGGFGKCVVIAHKNGYQTLYGHLNRIMVKTGRKVNQGQLIGRVGMTGRTTGPHLHFTIYHKGHVENPLKFLW